MDNPSLANEHAEIRNLLAKYCLYLDLDEFEAWADLFTPDGVFEVYGREFAGHQGLRDMAAAAGSGLHLGGPPVIEIEGDRARATRNLLFHKPSEGETRYAVYDDDLVRTADGWRIARTRCRFHGPDGLADRPPKPKS